MKLPEIDPPPMTDDIQDSAVPFEQIVGSLQPDPNLLTPQQGLEIAGRESFVVSAPYSVAVAALPGDMTKLEVIRMVGGVTRSHSMAISRARTAAAFSDMSRRVWLMLLDEHEREDRGHG